MKADCIVLWMGIWQWQTSCSAPGLLGGSVWRAGSSGASAPLSETSWGGTPPARSKSHRGPLLLRAAPPTGPWTPPQGGLMWRGDSRETTLEVPGVLWARMCADDQSTTDKCADLTWQVNIGGPVASLVFEGTEASAMKCAVFSLRVRILWKHGQKATRKW